jgi:hypothetical protein
VVTNVTPPGVLTGPEIRLAVQELTRRGTRYVIGLRSTHASSHPAVFVPPTARLYLGGG